MKRASAKRLLLVSILFMATAGNAQTLTRPAAQTLIDAYPDFASTDRLSGVDDAAFSKAIQDHLWRQAPQGWQPTAAGELYFKEVSLFATTLRQPLHRKVTSITGIADGDDASRKTAEFTWHFTDLTEPVATYTAATTDDHKGAAELRHYDDGWRVADVHLDSYRDGSNARPFAVPKLSPAEALQEAVDQVCKMSIAWEGHSINPNTYCIAQKCDGAVSFNVFLAALADEGFSRKTLFELDPWGHPYRFFVSNHGKSFEVRSLGPSGKLNLSLKGRTNARTANIARAQQWIVSPIHPGQSCQD
jgi:hypothetical protein